MSWQNHEIAFYTSGDPDRTCSRGLLSMLRVIKHSLNITSSVWECFFWIICWIFLEIDSKGLCLCSKKEKENVSVITSPIERDENEISCHSAKRTPKKKSDVALPILTYLIFPLLVAVTATLLGLPTVWRALWPPLASVSLSLVILARNVHSSQGKK